MSDWGLKMPVQEVIDKYLQPDEKLNLPRDEIMDDNDKYLMEQAVMRTTTYDSLKTGNRGGSRRRRSRRRFNFKRKSRKNFRGGFA